MIHVAMPRGMKISPTSNPSTASKTPFTWTNQSHVHSTKQSFHMSKCNKTFVCMKPWLVNSWRWLALNNPYITLPVKTLLIIISIFSHCSSHTSATLRHCPSFQCGRFLRSMMPVKQENKTFGQDRTRKKHWFQQASSTVYSTVC